MLAMVGSASRIGFSFGFLSSSNLPFCGFLLPSSSFHKTELDESCRSDPPTTTLLNCRDDSAGNLASCVDIFNELYETDIRNERDVVRQAMVNRGSMNDVFPFAAEIIRRLSGSENPCSENTIT